MSKDVNTLLHLGTVLREHATEAGTVSKANSPYDEGRAMAYYEVICILEECCEIFDLKREELALDNFSSESLL